MPAETTPHRKGKDNYTVVFVPSDQSKKSRSFSVNSLGIIGIFVSAIVFITVGLLAVIVYTPVGTYLPVASPELEMLYGQRVQQIQTELTSLMNEVHTLQLYNIQLRKALGENVLNRNQQGKQDSKGDLKRNQTEKNERAAVAVSESVMQRNETVSVPVKSQSFMYELVTKQEFRFPLVIPVIGYTTRGFDADGNHFGIDLVAKEGNPVLAAAHGSVLYADWTYDDGWMIIVAHGDGYTTVYKHNKSLLKQRGESVKRGENIALLGNTGRASSGPHVHFEVWKNSVTLNPMDYLNTIQ
ncbi:MAG: peptidoglycan DD-metalloendopeptidase family protein [Ignavibacteriae bacterium]|nr:peptidoglycan DD-metalloendopeptidase family protein [Ignavibacteriota bacterium]